MQFNQVLLFYYILRLLLFGFSSPLSVWPSPYRDRGSTRGRRVGSSCQLSIVFDP